MSTVSVIIQKYEHDPLQYFQQGDTVYYEVPMNWNCDKVEILHGIVSVSSRTTI